MNEHTTVLIVGAGWIGLEVASAAESAVPKLSLSNAQTASANAGTRHVQWLHDLHVRNGRNSLRRLDRLF